METVSKVETRGAEQQKTESIAYLEPIDDPELPAAAYSVDLAASPPSSRSVSFLPKRVGLVEAFPKLLVGL